MDRLHLLKGGVYVAPYDNRYPLADVLFNVLNEEEQHKWTDQELSEALVQMKPMASIALQDRLNPTMTSLAIATKAQHAQQPQFQPQPQHQLTPALLSMPPVTDLPAQRASGQPVPTIPFQFRPQLPLPQSIASVHEFWSGRTPSLLLLNFGAAFACMIIIIEWINKSPVIGPIKQ
jgi:hypothetical protein